VQNLKANALSLILGLVFLCGAPSVYAQLVNSTGETLVNTNTTDSTQQNCAVAMDTSGRYVVVWESEHEDGDGFGIFAKIYNEDHTVRVPDFEITTASDDRVNDQRFPDVAMTADGTWCVTWQSQEDEGWSTVWLEWRTQGWDVYRRVYTIDGTAVSSRSRVNSSTARNQMHPAIAAGDNRFVITWTSEVSGQNESEIKERYFLSNGANLAATTVVHSSTGNHLTHSDVAMSASGEYVFTWQADGLDGDRKGIYMAVHDNSYALVLGPTQVNTTTAGNQQEPRVAMDENGDFMIVWSSFDQDGDHFGIYGQRYTNGGVANGGEIAITTNTTGSQDHAAIAVSREGGKYIISWTDNVADGDKSGVYSRTMYSNGSFLANDALINTTTANYQNFSDVAIGTDATEAVYAWQSGVNYGATGQADPSYYGIYSQGMVVEDTTPPVAVCQNITVYLDGAGNASIVPSDIDGGSTDNIGIESMTASLTDFTCANIGPNSSTLTVYDAVGLNDDCVAIVTVIDTISPTIVCQNITVYLNGTGNATIAASDVDAGSTDNCGAITLSASKTSFTCADVGPNNVTLTVNDGSGNSSTCIAVITVIDNPSVSISYTGTPYCSSASPASVTLTGTTGGGFTSSPVGLTMSSTTGLITPSSSTAGVYTVTYTIPASGGCASATATTSVTITANPSATISYADTPYCSSASPASVTLTGTTGGGFTSSPVGLTMSSTTGLITPSSSTAGVYTVTYTIPASGGCASATATTSVTITADPSPPTGNTPQEFCDGANIEELVVSSSAIFDKGVGGIAKVDDSGIPTSPYKWYNAPSDGYLLATTEVLTNGTTYYVSQTVNGCEGTARLAITATVNPKPETPTISASDLEICIGESINLSATYYGGTPSELATYHWTDNLTGQNITVSPSNSKSYKVLVKSPEGCSSDSSEAINIIVNQLPQDPILISDNSSLCKGQNVIVTGTCEVGMIFHWTTPSTVVVGQETSALSNTNQRIVNTPGTYTAYCESDKGCLSGQVSITIIETENCGNSIFLSITPERPVICPGTSISLSVSGCTGTLAWFGGTVNQSGNTATVSPASNTTYFVTCSTGGSATVDVAVAPNNKIVNANISIGKEYVKAVQTIESNKKVGDPNITPAPNVVYEAGNAIYLNPGFKTTTPSTFSARIKTCPN
jgi:hypothetical protein